MQGWINIYKAGYWHKPGKVDAFDRHAGDIYPSKEAAHEHIERPDLYVDTVLVEWTDPEGMPQPNKETRVAIS